MCSTQQEHTFFCCVLPGLQIPSMARKSNVCFFVKQNVGKNKNGVKTVAELFFEANFCGNLTCYNCGRKFTKEYAQANMEFSDCRFTREYRFELGELDREYYCSRCGENCIFAEIDDSEIIDVKSEMKSLSPGRLPGRGKNKRKMKMILLIVISVIIISGLLVFFGGCING